MDFESVQRMQLAGLGGAIGQPHTSTLSTGTTTLGIICKDAVVLAADQRASMGNLIATKKFRKVYKVAPTLAMTLAGSVGDAQMMVRLLRAEMKLYELQEKRVTIKAASTLLSNILRTSYKSFTPELVQLILGGVDERGPQLYSLDATGGATLENDYTFSGSGSPVAVGVLEDGYKRGMSVDEGMDLAARAIRAARERDVFTGTRTLDIAIITKKGVEFLTEDRIAKLLKEK